MSVIYPPPANALRRRAIPGVVFAPLPQLTRGNSILPPARDISALMPIPVEHVVQVNVVEPVPTQGRITPMAKPSADSQRPVAAGVEVPVDPQLPAAEPVAPARTDRVASVRDAAAPARRRITTIVTPPPVTTVTPVASARKRGQINPPKETPSCGCQAKATSAPVSVAEASISPSLPASAPSVANTDAPSMATISSPRATTVKPVAEVTRSATVASETHAEAARASTTTAVIEPPHVAAKPVHVIEPRDAVAAAPVLPISERPIPAAKHDPRDPMEILVERFVRNLQETFPLSFFEELGKSGTALTENFLPFQHFSEKVQELLGEIQRVQNPKFTQAAAYLEMFQQAHVFFRSCFDYRMKRAARFVKLRRWWDAARQLYKAESVVKNTDIFTEEERFVFQARLSLVEDQLSRI